jgi:hypothetical protein
MSGCLSKKIKDKVIILCGDSKSKNIFINFIQKTFGKYFLHIGFDESLVNSVSDKDYRLIYISTSNKEILCSNEVINLLSGNDIIFKSVCGESDITKLDSSILLDLDLVMYDEKIKDKIIYIPFNCSVDYDLEKINKINIPLFWLLINKYNDDEKIYEYLKVKNINVHEIITNTICDHIWGF